MKVVVVGAGIGGLSCAIACRREGLDVIVLERVAQILPVRKLQYAAARLWPNCFLSH
jgi:flavin-dependent dehydrogenase